MRKKIVFFNVANAASLLDILANVPEKSVEKCDLRVREACFQTTQGEMDFELWGFSLENQGKWIYSNATIANRTDLFVIAVTDESSLSKAEEEIKAMQREFNLNATQLNEKFLLVINKINSKTSLLTTDNIKAWQKKKNISAIPIMEVNAKADQKALLEKITTLVLNSASNNKSNPSNQRAIIKYALTFILMIGLVVLFSLAGAFFLTLLELTLGISLPLWVSISIVASVVGSLTAIIGGRIQLKKDSDSACEVSSNAGMEKINSFSADKNKEQNNKKEEENVSEEEVSSISNEDSTDEESYSPFNVKF